MTLAQTSRSPEPEDPPADPAIVPHATLARIAAAAVQADRDGSFPQAGIQAVQEAGLLQATVARRYGGPGGGIETLVSIITQIGRADPSVALIVSMTLSNHLAQAERNHWPEAYYRDLVEQGRKRAIRQDVAGRRAAASEAVPDDLHCLSAPH